MNNSASSLVYAIGLGAIAGMRSMAAPALLSRRLARHKRPWDRLLPRSTAVRLLSSPLSAMVLPLLAAAEMVADKTPVIPPRTAPIPLAGRAASGALCGAVVAARRGTSQPIAAVLGALAAVGTTYLAYHLRKAAGDATGVPDIAFALIEDAIVVTAGDGLSAAVA